jgi:putative ABC transport system permease protein
VLLLLGALTIGFVLSLLALGVFISFRIFAFPDITAEGSFTLGASVVAVLLIAHVNPFQATLAAFVAGATAGTVTGVIHTRFGINRLLSGILVMTALFSVNLHVMQKSNLPLMDERTLATYAEKAGSAMIGRPVLHAFGWEMSTRDLSLLGAAFLVAIVVAGGLFAFLKTQLGTAMQAAGDNDQMIRALGVSVNTMIVLGLALSNGLVATAGALLAQYQGFADVQMGIGMVVWGLASIIIGEALVGVRQIGYMITGAIMGSVLFRLLVAIALRGGLDPNDLKLITAAFVFAALVLPGVGRHFTARKAAA